VRLRASEIAAAVDGVVVGTDVDVAGVTIDSRTATPDQLFVPIVGDRDGHDFIGDAVARGASAYLTANGVRSVDATAVEVTDTGRALLGIGRLARSHVMTERVVGITGSVGKTTVKDLTRAALASTYRTAASERSFNNELGVPLTLANAPDDVEVVVVEMGARGRGHITLLADIALPTIAVVTTVALAHTEMFGTIDDVATAKAELVEALPYNGIAVLNADNPYVAGMARRTTATILTFSAESADADITASAVILDDELRPTFLMHTPSGNVQVRLPFRGVHQVANALAAAGAALAGGVELDAIATGLAGATGSPWRMELVRTASGAVVVNDAYNANPTSTAAALRSLAALPAKRRVAVLGVMAELGETSVAEHRRITALADELEIVVIAVDAPEYGVPVVADVDAALDALGPVSEGDAILVKGSRVAGLERLASALTD
jgi:UDP-N-acetylmuramoyl-tripeptide--D-alanyl-D-alanine ligase